jgi:hypothetical protein
MMMTVIMMMVITMFTQKKYNKRCYKIYFPYANIKQLKSYKYEDINYNKKNEMSNQINIRQVTQLIIQFVVCI